jgi:hypothetical protein
MPELQIQKNTSFARQWHGKHVSVVMDNRNFGSDIFYVDHDEAI